MNFDITKVELNRGPACVAARFPESKYGQLEHSREPEVGRGKAILHGIGPIVTLKLAGCFMRQGYRLKEADILAARFKQAMEKHPDAERLSLLILEKGSQRILPSEGLDTSTNFISGGALEMILEINVATLRLAVEKAMAEFVHRFDGGEPDEEG